MHRSWPACVNPWPSKPAMHHACIGNGNAARATAMLAVVALALCLAGCATTQGHYTLIGPRPAARTSSNDILVISSGAPKQPYTVVCHLNAHLEKTGFVESTLSEAMPMLKQQASLCGADAIIDIQQQRSSVVETRILNVTGTGIRFNASN